MASELVLVDGTTGFVGSAVALEFIKQGFSVRGTARSQSKADAWNKLHPETRGNIEWAIVEDIGSKDAFDKAIKGVTIFAHTASPFHFNVKDNEKDMLLPAIEGTKNALQAAAKEKSVKRVIITSSFAANLDLSTLPGVGINYTDDDWNPATYDQAKTSDNVAFVYCASKALAEKAAWDFVAQEKPGFALSVVNPPMVFGPPEQVVDSLESLNTSVASLWGIVDAKEVAATTFPVFVDSRDLALAHFKAATEDVAKGQRYLLVADHYDNTKVAAIIRSSFPDQAHRIPGADVVDIKNGVDHFATDSSKAERELGIKFTSFEQSVRETLEKLFQLEKSLKASQ